MVFDWPYQVALGSLTNQEFIDKERQRLGPLFAQEYECAFLGSQNTAIPEAVIKQTAAEHARDR